MSLTERYFDKEAQTFEPEFVGSVDAVYADQLFILSDFMSRAFRVGATGVVNLQLFLRLIQEPQPPHEAILLLLVLCSCNKSHSFVIAEVKRAWTLELAAFFLKDRRLLVVGEAAVD